MPVIVFPGVGQPESYYLALFRHTRCALFFLEYDTLTRERFADEAAALEALDNAVKGVASGYGRQPLWLAYSFGGRIALKMWARRPASACKPEQLLLVAADGLCGHPLYRMATRPFLRPIITRLIRCKGFQNFLLFVLPYWGFKRKALTAFFERWTPAQIYDVWCFWAVSPSPPNLWPAPVWYVGAEKDRIFPMRCMRRLALRYPEKIRLTLLKNSTHFIAPPLPEPAIKSWLSGKHHQDKNEDIQP